MSDNVLQLEYASALSLGRPQVYAAARSMMWLAVMSGLCVGVCFLWFADVWIAHVLHIAIFGFTIFLAIQSGIRLTRGTSDIEAPAQRLRRTMDYIAGGGLLVLALAPIDLWIHLQDQYAQLMLGLAFLAMAITAPRHVMLYRFLASFCTQVGRSGMARSMQTLGWFKSIYEAIWLGCCALALLISAARDIFGLTSAVSDGAIVFAVGALFGCVGFAGIWIWMLICHARFVQLMK